MFAEFFFFFFFLTSFMMACLTTELFALQCIIKKRSVLSICAKNKSRFVSAKDKVHFSNWHPSRL